MTSWFGFHSTNLKAPVPTGRFPNSVPDVSTARGLAMSKTNIARLARNGACGSFRVMRGVCVPAASPVGDHRWVQLHRFALRAEHEGLSERGHGRAADTDDDKEREPRKPHTSQPP